MDDSTTETPPYPAMADDEKPLLINNVLSGGDAEEVKVKSLKSSLEEEACATSGLECKCCDWQGVSTSLWTYLYILNSEINHRERCYSDPRCVPLVLFNIFAERNTNNSTPFSRYYIQGTDKRREPCPLLSSSRITKNQRQSELRRTQLLCVT